MIPQERIEQAAKEHADTQCKMGYDCSLDDFLEYAVQDFTAGVRFAESEMKPIAIEFAEWIESNCVYLCANLWEKVTEPDSACYSSTELFDKFLNERSAQ